MDPRSPRSTPRSPPRAPTAAIARRPQGRHWRGVHRVASPPSSHADSTRGAPPPPALPCAPGSRPGSPSSSPRCPGA
eukprot:6487231-Prorocentrum_lima.AAC.1